MSYIVHAASRIRAITYGIVPRSLYIETTLYYDCTLRFDETGNEKVKNNEIHYTSVRLLVCPYLMEICSQYKCGMDIHGVQMNYLLVFSW